MAIGTTAAAAAATLRAIDMMDTSAANPQRKTTAAASGGRGVMTTGAAAVTAMQKTGGHGTMAATLTSAVEGSGNEPAACALRLQTLILKGAHFQSASAAHT